MDAREKLNIAWEHQQTELAAKEAFLFQSTKQWNTELFREYAPVIHTLWQDRAIKKAFDRRREFQLVRIIFLL